MAMSQLANQLSALRERREALDWAQIARERALQSVGPDHPLTLFTSMGFGEALQARGNLAEAVPEAWKHRMHATTHASTP